MNCSNARITVNFLNEMKMCCKCVCEVGLSRNWTVNVSVNCTMFRETEHAFVEWLLKCGKCELVFMNTCR